MSLYSTFKALFTSAPRLAPADCIARVRSGAALLIDVRERAEWAGGIAQSARPLAFSDLTGARAQWKPFLAEARGREVFLYCASGARSGLAARILVAEGVRAANTGGFAEWLDAGWPVARPPQPTSKAK